MVCGICFTTKNYFWNTHVDKKSIKLPQFVHRIIYLLLKSSLPELTKLRFLPKNFISNLSSFYTMTFCNSGSLVFVSLSYLCVTSWTLVLVQQRALQQVSSNVVLTNSTDLCFAISCGLYLGLVNLLWFCEMCGTNSKDKTEP